MSTKAGQAAEQAAADFLRGQGYTILDRNWRTRWCEIDIIAQKGRAVRFVEVKYRHTTDYGHGLDYITPRKLRQMHFAAEFWLAQNADATTDYYLAGLEITGPTLTVTAWLEDL